MKNKMVFKLILTVLFSFGVFASNAQIKVLSGQKGSTYEMFGKDVAKHMKTKTEVLNSGGSVDNFIKIYHSAFGANFALLPLDVLFVNELTEMNVRRNIKILAPLFTDEVHLIVSANSKITTIKDLKNKKVAVGDKSQGSSITARMIKRIVQVDWESVSMDVEDAKTALKDGKIDAIFYVGAKPSKILQSLKNVRLLNVDDPALSSVYPQTTIPKGTYKWQKEDIKTCGILTVLVTNIAEKSDEVKYIKEVLLTVKKNLNKLKEGNSIWKEVNVSKEQFKKIYNWPVHVAAKKVFDLK